MASAAVPKTRREVEWHNAMEVVPTDIHVPPVLSKKLQFAFMPPNENLKRFASRILSAGFLYWCRCQKSQATPQLMERNHNVFTIRGPCVQALVPSPDMR